MRLLIGAVIGLVIGAALGYWGKCKSGTCPITKNPISGALMGALLGGLIALAFTRGMADSPNIAHVQSEEDFDYLVLQSPKPVVVDFYADWCPPCRQLAPVLSEWADAHIDQARVVKVNVDKFPKLAEKYQAKRIPLVVVFDRGQVKRRFSGFDASQPEAWKKSVTDEVLKYQNGKGTP